MEDRELIRELIDHYRPLADSLFDQEETIRKYADHYEDVEKVRPALEPMISQEKVLSK